MNSFSTKKTANLAGNDRTIYSLKALEEQGYNLDRLPYSLKVLLENLLRHEDGKKVDKGDIEALLNWDSQAKPTREIAYTPSRVLLQDFTGVACVVDLAVMRDAMAELGGDPGKINPLQPVELVIDHSVQVDAYGSDAAHMINLDLEFQRNAERYQFLKWGKLALDNFKVVPPNTGICHQVNLEYLGRVVFDQDGTAFPDTLVGTDSHTTMINGIGVLGWGVGGIEAEAAMLGQPVPMLLPQVVGFELKGKLSEGATATDLVLTIVEMLRKHGVVGKFVEFFGEGIAGLPLADRATIANMAPEYGATCGIFPIDDETMRYLTISGREEGHIALAKDYLQQQGMYHSAATPTAEYSSVVTLDLADVEPSVAGPKRPQDRSILSEAKDSLYAAYPNAHPGENDSASGSDELTHSSVVIAAITSCTNTSNPSVMLAAGLVARKARALGIKPKPWVKTSLAPGSKVVTRYLEQAGVLEDLAYVGYDVVGYGCTTCIGNSGPLPEEVSKEVDDRDLTVVSVLSGNRNFEGRISSQVKANYLMSPPLVVAYALAGTFDIDITKDAIAQDQNGNDVFLKDIWPSQAEVADTVEKNITREMYTKEYASVFDGDEKWKAVEASGSSRFDWDLSSTYIQKAPFFEGMGPEAPEEVAELSGLNVIAKLGDTVTTDHISPAGAINADSPAGKYLIDRGVRPHLFNSYGTRRGSHDVMMRGTFANVRLRNQMAPGTEGGWTTFLPTGEVMSIYDAAVKYGETESGLIVLAGKEYGTGSSRDWAAKGTRLLGIKIVLAESFERIHRSNLVGMGVLPLVFAEGDTADSLGLTGQEEYALVGLKDAVKNGFSGGKTLTMHATTEDGTTTKFDVVVRLDTPTEVDYYRHGGVLQYVLRSLLS
jgi:aconitate hydratase